jgi:hypothetical protein
MTDHIPNTMMNINEIIDGNSIVIMYEQRQTERETESQSRQTNSQRVTADRQGVGRTRVLLPAVCPTSNFLSLFVF